MADICLSFFHFLGGGGQNPLTPWTSACPPTPFHFACTVYQSPLDNQCYPYNDLVICVICKDSTDYLLKSSKSRRL